MERLKVIFDDYGRAVPKVGTLVKEDALFIFLKLDDGRTEVIAKSRIIRMVIEVDGNGGSGRK